MVGGDVLVLPSLRRDRPESAAFTAAVGGLYAAGVPVVWGMFFPAGARRVELPTYAFQRQRYWLSDSAVAPAPLSDIVGIGHGSVRCSLSAESRCSAV